LAELLDGEAEARLSSYRYAAVSQLLTPCVVACPRSTAAKVLHVSVLPHTRNSGSSSCIRRFTRKHRRINQDLPQESAPPFAESSSGISLARYLSYSHVTTSAGLNVICSDFDLAEQLFDEIYADYPTRFEDLDTYSNILYVMGKRSKLSQVAHKYSAIDRNRPETCCLIGELCSNLRKIVRD
jgi:hypothetical protein